MNKRSYLLAIPFLAVACAGEVTDEAVSDTESSLQSAWAEKKLTHEATQIVQTPDGKKPMVRKPAPQLPVPVCTNGAIPGTMPGCAEGYTVECEYEGFPYCCECVEDNAPPLTCETVLCQAGHSCEEDCDGNPVCVPIVCEGFAGLSCPENYACLKTSQAPDQGGKCVTDCSPPTCGECTSDSECGTGESCTAAVECLSSCSCPTCAVCAGHCVPEEN